MKTVHTFTVEHREIRHLGTEALQAQYIEDMARTYLRVNNERYEGGDVNFVFPINKQPVVMTLAL